MSSPTELRPTGTECPSKVAVQPGHPSIANTTEPPWPVAETSTCSWRTSSDRAAVTVVPVGTKLRWLPGYGAGLSRS